MSNFVRPLISRSNADGLVRIFLPFCTQPLLNQRLHHVNRFLSPPHFRCASSTLASYLDRLMRIIFLPMSSATYGIYGPATVGSFVHSVRVMGHGLLWCVDPAQRCVGLTFDAVLSPVGQQPFSSLSLCSRLQLRTTPLASIGMSWGRLVCFVIVQIQSSWIGQYVHRWLIGGCGIGAMSND